MGFGFFFVGMYPFPLPSTQLAFGLIVLFNNVLIGCDMYQSNPRAKYEYYQFTSHLSGLEPLTIRLAAERALLYRGISDDC